MPFVLQTLCFNKRYPFELGVGAILILVFIIFYCNKLYYHNYFL